MNKKDAQKIGDIIALPIDGLQQPSPNTLLNIIKDIILLDTRISDEIKLYDNGEAILTGFIGEPHER
jgi:hypothetical protein